MGAQVIAKVRIAPVERWCEHYIEKLQQNPLYANLPGMEVAIIPESLSVLDDRHDEEFKWWQLETESAKEMLKVIGKHKKQPRPNWGLCEHMLEMD